VKILAVALALVVACKKAEPPPPDRDPIVAMMARYDELILAMDSAAIARLFTADGAIVNAGKVMATGPAEVAGFLATFDGKIKVEKTRSTIDESTVTEPTARVGGTYAQTARVVESGRALSVSGRFTAELVRDESGWRFRRLETMPER
jgi:hypothetical protein